MHLFINPVGGVVVAAVKITEGSRVGKLNSKQIPLLKWMKLFCEVKCIKLECLMRIVYHIETKFFCYIPYKCIFCSCTKMRVNQGRGSGSDHYETFNRILTSEDIKNDL